MVVATLMRIRILLVIKITTGSPAHITTNAINDNNNKNNKETEICYKLKNVFLFIKD